MGISRRAVIKGLLAGGVGAVTGTAVYGTAYERHQIDITRAVLPVSGLAPLLDGLRIAFLTDIHHSETVPAADVTRAVDLALAQRPDLIVLGGDYVTYGDRAYVGPVAELWRRSPRHTASSRFSATTMTIATWRRRFRHAK
jgi:uncharacterized protein